MVNKKSPLNQFGAIASAVASMQSQAQAIGTAPQNVDPLTGLPAEQAALPVDSYDQLAPGGVNSAPINPGLFSQPAGAMEGVYGQGVPNTYNRKFREQ